MKFCPNPLVNSDPVWQKSPLSSFESYRFLGDGGIPETNGGENDYQTGYSYSCFTPETSYNLFPWLDLPDPLVNSDEIFNLPDPLVNSDPLNEVFDLPDPLVNFQIRNGRKGGAGRAF